MNRNECISILKTESLAMRLIPPDYDTKRTAADTLSGTQTSGRQVRQRVKILEYRRRIHLYRL
jgi:hypothetical protein